MGEYRDMKISNTFYIYVINFFLKLHYLAMFYTFFVVPLFILGGYLGKFITFPFILMVFLAPIGPTSTVIQGIYLYMLLPPEFSPRYNPLLYVTVITVFKIPIYAFLKRTIIINHSTSLVLLIITLITCSISTLVWRHIAALVASLVVTVSMDLVVFSYVKFRDATNGIASRKWIPILTILWSLAIWLPVIISPKGWFRWIRVLFPSLPLVVIIAIWATITIVQVLFSIKYYYVAELKTRKELSGIKAEFRA